MTGDMLSQEEIDALLKMGDTDEEPEQLDVTDYLTDMEQDALGEIGNISFGSSATALSTLLNQKVEITTPEVSVIDDKRLEDEFPHPYVAIQVKYTEGFLGKNILVIKQDDAAIIADLMLGGDGKSPSEMMEEIHLSAVQEAMNQMMGSAATSMSSIFNKRVDISPPSIDLLDFESGEGTDTIPRQNLLVRVSLRLKIGELIDSNIMQVIPVDFAKSLVYDLMNQHQDTNEQEQIYVDELKNEPTEEILYTSHSSQYDYEVEEKQEKTKPQEPKRQPNVQVASFEEFNQPTEPSVDTRNLNMLLDIPLQVTVELGRTKRTVKDILELGTGSIIELDKLAGEPVDILVNNRLIAQGEVVVIDENFGVRVTDIVSQEDRLKRLK